MPIAHVIQSRLAALRAALSVPHRTIAMSLLRITLGGIVLMTYVQHIYQRAFLWGNSGVIPFDDFIASLHAAHSYSLYQLSSSPAFAAAMFYLGLAVTLAFTLGYHTRLATIGFFICTWSLDARNPVLLDGGDNLLILVAFFMMFADCGAHLSLDARNGRRTRPPRPAVAMLHNYAVLAVIIQICLLYATSAFYKIQGHMWQDGTALYYVLRTSEFNLSGLGHLISMNAFAVTLLTYATLAFQMAYPFLIWNRRTTWLMALGAVSFHVSIAYCMGLVWFSAVMISAELAIFGDASYMKLVGGILRLRAGLSRLRAAAYAGTRRLGASPALSRYQLAVYYDGACPLCVAAIRGLAFRLDLLGLLQPVSFRDPTFDPPIGTEMERLERRMHVCDARGRLRSGMPAIAAVVYRVPPLWWMAPAIWLISSAGLGDRLYDYIASRRTIIPVNGCTDARCAVPNSTSIAQRRLVR